jgi:hypothetical protein
MFWGMPRGIPPGISIALRKFVAPNERGEKDLELARLILRYVRRRPHAKDTPEGIAAWWVRQQRIEEAVEEVSRALRLLVARDLLIERETRGRRRYYKLNRNRIAEVSQFLDDTDRAGGVAIGDPSSGASS